jgi:four helix bundle protein
MRDHTKLRAFQHADELALMVYSATSSFPADERFGLTNQMRRAAVWIASNIVEGCARSTEKDYLWFLDMAYGSARELAYQTTIAVRLKYLRKDVFQTLQSKAVETSKVLSGLIRSIRKRKDRGNENG